MRELSSRVEEHSGRPSGRDGGEGRRLRDTVRTRYYKGRAMHESRRLLRRTRAEPTKKTPHPMRPGGSTTSHTDTANDPVDESASGGRLSTGGNALSEEQLLALFRETSTFTVRSALKQEALGDDDDGAQASGDDSDAGEATEDDVRRSKSRES
jgi:hypothetical protein